MHATNQLQVTSLSEMIILFCFKFPCFQHYVEMRHRLTRSKQMCAWCNPLWYNNTVNRRYEYLGWAQLPHSCNARAPVSTSFTLCDSHAHLDTPTIQLSKLHAHLSHSHLFIHSYVSYTISCWVNLTVTDLYMVFPMWTNMCTTII